MKIAIGCDHGGYLLKQDILIWMEENDIDAVYRMKGGRELLTLTCLSTGACVELDVTGWMEEQPDSPEEPPAPDESTPT